MPPAVSDNEVAISTIVRLPVRTRGSRMMPRPFETASIPVNVPPPSANARKKISIIAPRPRVPRSWPRSVETLLATAPASPRLLPIAPTMTTACVTRKIKKIGVRIRIDSLTPRRLSSVKPPSTASTETSLYVCHDCGRKLNTASPADAIETAIVRT